MLVSAVDQERKTLVGLWMLAVTVQEPEITRAFQITLPAKDNKVNEKVCLEFQWLALLIKILLVIY